MGHRYSSYDFDRKVVASFQKLHSPSYGSIKTIRMVIKMILNRLFESLMFYLALVRNGVLLTVICLVFNGETIAKSTRIPLQYYPEYGLYTVTLSIGQQAKERLEAVVDTGSAALVLVPSVRHCPQCIHAYTKGYVNPHQIDIKNRHATLRLDYGSSFDTLAEYEGAVGFNLLTDPVWMSMYLIKKSSQPVSILGLVPHNIKINAIRSTPFIRKITNEFATHKHLNFVLCGTRGDSYLEFGQNPLPSPDIATTLFMTPFYEIGVSGFYDDHQKPIAKTKSAYSPAVLDTGTGGFIVLSNHLYEPLHRYLYASSGQSNQKLNKRFWNKNYCVPRNAVDFKSFPVLNIGVASLSGGAPQFFKLPPTAYINRAGCPEDYVRLVFNTPQSQTLFTSIRNHHTRTAMGRTPEMVIGTSLLNHYAFSIQYQPQPLIYFNENDRLCEKIKSP